MHKDSYPCSLRSLGHSPVIPRAVGWPRSMKTPPIRKTLLACVLVTLLMTQVVTWAVSPNELEGAAWVALLENNSGSPTQAVPCLAIEEPLWQLTSGRDRRRAAAFTERMGIDLTTHRGAAPTPYQDCSYIWADTDFSTPALGRVTVSYFHSDSNGDAVLLVPLFGRWLYVASWNLWF